MSKPVLYAETETDFTNNGIGILSDCVSCEVTEVRNGEFELTMKYPSSGIHYADITDRAIIKSRINQSDKPQLFRVYSCSKPMNGIVTVSAAHISYDLSGIPVVPFSASSAAEAMAGLKNKSAVDCPFEFWTDKETVATFSSEIPKSIRACLGGSSGSILDVYGGELEFDNYTVKLYNSRGENRGVTIRYGKNLTDIKQDENCSSVYTGVYPYWLDTNGENLLQLDELIVNASGNYNFSKIKTLDLSSYFDERPTQDQLRQRAERYMTENDIGIPKISLTVSFAQLDQTEEYKGMAFLDRVFLCDTVNVEFPALGVSTTAKAIKIVYDVLLDRVKSVTLGSSSSSIIDTVVNQQQAIEKVESPTYLQQAVSNATNWITNGNGYVVISKNDDGQASEILIMDTPDINTAVNVWRWNSGGLGYSSTGYAGPYTTAITQDGKIVADFVTTGVLNANIISSGVLQSNNGNFSFNLDTGEMYITGYSTSEEVNVLTEELLTIKTESGNLAITLQDIVDNGTTKVITKIGYTFDDSGLHIQKGGSEIENTIDDTGMYVTRSGEMMLKANADGVEATDLKAKNYLLIGNYCRIEDYSNGSDTKRTAIFWLDEEGE